MDAIILAGGKGNRMEDVLPKPLVKVKDKAIIGHQLDYLLGTKKLDRIILSVGYKAEEIMGYVKANYPGYPLEFSVETEPLGTAGALRKALEQAQSENFVCLNCDDITDIDLARLEALGANAICVAHPQLPFGLVSEENGFAKFIEKPILEEWVSCGWYFFAKNELLELLPAKGSLEYDVFPQLKLKVYKHEGFWQPLNTKKDILEFESKSS
jgi:D-glycero-alpha-D-manno-heptose 1-phosphate guanylyltransferase